MDIEHARAARARSQRRLPTIAQSVLHFNARNSPSALMTPLRPLMLLFCLAAFPACAQELSLALPLACALGTDCWVQQYPAHGAASGGGASDYRCGHESYPQHDGTDFRVRDTSVHVPVLASAAGMVKAARDGVSDHLVKNDLDLAAVKGRECGNGVVIQHEGGFETQYCHLLQGSVLVKPGEPIAAGAKLGEVGYSGQAAFPHVHLTVRRDGKALDPFDGGPAVGAKCGSGGPSLWNRDAAGALAYDAYGDLIGAGFQDGPVVMEGLETGKTGKDMPAKDWPALVAFMWAINLSAGDTINVTLKGPGNVSAENSVTLDRNKAQYLLFAGKKRPQGGWPAGTYRGRVTVTNGAEVRLKREWQAELR
jgi:Peptidase family M23